MSTIGAPYFIFIILTILVQGSQLTFGRRTPKYYNPYNELHVCPSGYAFHYLTKTCVWFGPDPQPIWQIGFDSFEETNRMHPFSPQTGGGSEDHKCPDGYKFSKPLRLCLLAHLCNYCLRGDSPSERKQEEVTEKPDEVASGQTLYAIPYKCIC